MEFLDLLNPEIPGHPFSALSGGEQIIAEGSWNHEVGGYNLEHGYCLFYFGMRQTDGMLLSREKFIR